MGHLNGHGRNGKCLVFLWCSDSKFKLAGVEALQEIDAVLSRLIIRTQFQKHCCSFSACSSYVNGTDDAITHRGTVDYTFGTYKTDVS